MLAVTGACASRCGRDVDAVRGSLHLAELISYLVVLVVSESGFTRHLPGLSADADAHPWVVLGASCTEVLRW
jgi:hypothetical protein